MANARSSKLGPIGIVGGNGTHAHGGFREREPGGGAPAGRASGLVIAGAVAKGAFAAGALSVIAADAPHLNITSVVGTSSGALNGAVFAAGLSVGESVRAAQDLERLWLNDASWWKILTHSQRMAIVLEALKPFEGKTVTQPLTLSLTVTSLNGETRPLRSGGSAHKRYRTDPSVPPHTRFQETYTFTSDDLVAPSKHEMIAEAAIASAAIPVVFRTGSVAGRGPYVDGGLVDNAPISLALGDPDFKPGDRAVDRVLIVTPAPRLVTKRHVGRFSLVRLLEIVVDERLARDLDDAHARNRKLDQLGRLLTPEQIRETTGWRKLDLVEVRPDADTPGGSFSGFFSRAERTSNLADGKAAARDALGPLLRLSTTAASS